MKKIFLLAAVLLITILSFGQNKRLLKGMYLQWGYNVEAYTKSNIRVRLSNGSDFILHNARATHKPDFDDIYKKSLQISLPQYNYRIGFYLNRSHTKAVELNFDHIKYVVKDGQTVHVTGVIEGQKVDGDSIMDPNRFMHLEHTDGGNLLHLNYVQQKTILRSKDGKRPLINFIWKAGAGINIPRTDFTWKGDELNNNFHIAGYNISGEAGARYYIGKRLFFEGTGKTGYVRYINALACTKALTGNRVRHGFVYFEAVALIGYDFSF